MAREGRGGGRRLRRLVSGSDDLEPGRRFVLASSATSVSADLPGGLSGDARVDSVIIVEASRNLVDVVSERAERSFDRRSC